MTVRKILVGVLAMTMASPAWGGGKPLGNIVSSSDATVRDTKLTAGSTLFVDDVISVSAHGAARIALAGGARAEILGNSSVRLTMADKKIQMVVGLGQASFHSTGPNEISAVVGDATVRPASGAETSAVIQSFSATHAIVAAEKGALLVTTAHDGKVYAVPEGEAADLSASVGSRQDDGAVPAGGADPPISARGRKKAVVWVVVIGSGGVALAAYLLSRNEAKLSPTQLGNEISPTKLN